MKYFWVSVLFLGFGLINLAQAQQEVISSLDDYREALNVVKITKNTGGLLPLQNLDKNHIAYLRKTPTLFRKTLEKYTHLHAWLGRQQQNDRNYILIAYIQSQKDITDLEAYTVMPNLKIVAVVSSKIKLLNLDWADAIVTIIANNEWTDSIAAQLIFGGVGVDGIPYRLGYAPPTDVGMDVKKLRDSIAAILNFGIVQKSFPGAQVLVAKNGKIIYHEAFGSPTFDKVRALKTNDIYDMASITKTTTALPILMKWSGEGRFDLDALLPAYWRDFKNSNKADLTWRNVLAHNARLKPWIPFWKTTLKKKRRIQFRRYKFWTFKTRKSRRYPVRITDNLWLHRRYKKKIFKAIRNSPLNEKQEYKYSGLAFYILPTMIEQMANVDFETYLKDEFYKPLGANSLTYNPLDFFCKDRIIPTENDTFFRHEQIQGTVHDEGAIMMGGVSSNAGLFGTANDMAKLWQMYLNKGRYGGKVFIDSTAVEAFTKCQFCPQGNHRGLGFDKPRIIFEQAKASYAKAASAATFGHAGYTGTLIWADPKNDLLFIFLSNRVYQTRNNRKLYTLDIRPRLHNAIYSSILKSKE